jgi:hypothetical protein
MSKPYAQYKSNGELWKAGNSIWGLCAAWNHATNPAAMLTDREYARSRMYARAIMARMQRLGWKRGEHYCELSNGALFPLSRKGAN